MVPVPSELLIGLNQPRPSETVHREECTQCFDNQDGPNGIDVCLTCFNGGCPTKSTNQHALSHFQKTGHSLVVNIKRVRKVIPKAVRDSNEPPTKKLAIKEDLPEEEKYGFQLTSRMYTGEESVDLDNDPKLHELVQGVLKSMSSAQKSEVKAWEEEIIACTHTTDLVQPAPKPIEKAGLATCAFEGCDLTTNLWLCLICGSLGCGRQQFGGGGGNGHGVLHTTTSGHAVAVKMGTIEPEGTADIYCYACDEPRLDPTLSEHLSSFGIEVASQKKTEKSMTELQIVQNLTFDFAMSGEDGKDIEPIFGPGLTGLKNLGNSCYMASTLQSLFSLPTFQTRYLTAFYTHSINCYNPFPATCFECQMAKVADGLLSGRYSVPREPEDPNATFYLPVESTPSTSTPIATPTSTPAFQEGIRPIMFKSLVGKGHVEFSTMKQQDAGEFLRHLLEMVKKSAISMGEIDPTTIFGFATEERLECKDCGGVRYKTGEEGNLDLPVAALAKKGESDGMEVDEKDSSSKEKAKVEYQPVELLGCLDRYTSPAAIEYNCPKCEKKVIALKTTRFATFPEVLVINAQRFTEDWVAQKLEVPIIVPYKSLSLDKYIGRGKQDHEVALPEDAVAANAGPTFDATAMAGLMEMGFPENRCKRALLATGNGNAEAAMEWVFAHMDDADIDDPIPETSEASPAVEHDEEKIANIVDMGFTAAQARKALRLNNEDSASAVGWIFENTNDSGDPPPSSTSVAASGVSKLSGSSDLPAEYRLKAFISHKGPSMHSGHYVAHVWTGEEKGWVLFNDEKVVKAEGGAQSAETLMGFAYVYIFEKKES